MRLPWRADGDGVTGEEWAAGAVFRLLQFADQQSSVATSDQHSVAISRQHRSRSP